jgi:hypothetical protein
VTIPTSVWKETPCPLSPTKLLQLPVPHSSEIKWQPPIPSPTKPPTRSPHYSSTNSSGLLPSKSMHLSLMLSQMIPPREPIRARPITTNDGASMASNARMNLLVSSQLELAFIWSPAAVDPTCDSSPSSVDIRILPKVWKYPTHRGYTNAVVGVGGVLWDWESSVAFTILYKNSVSFRYRNNKVCNRTQVLSQLGSILVNFRCCWSLLC